MASILVQKTEREQTENLVGGLLEVLGPALVAAGILTGLLLIARDSALIVIDPINSGLEPKFALNGQRISDLTKLLQDTVNSVSDSILFLTNR